jgi:hypothetical protein
VQALSAQAASRFSAAVPHGNKNAALLLRTGTPYGGCRAVEKWLHLPGCPVSSSSYLCAFDVPSLLLVISMPVLKNVNKDAGSPTASILTARCVCTGQTAVASQLQLHYRILAITRMCCLLLQYARGVCCWACRRSGQHSFHAQQTGRCGRCQQNSSPQSSSSSVRCKHIV